MTKTTTKRRPLTMATMATLILLMATSAIAGQFKVIRVYDGDTLLAEGHDIKIKVRLAGIDAPETAKKKRDTGQPFSQQAKKYLSQLVLNKTVDITGFGLDRYNRILGVLSINDININHALVYYGLAEVYRGKSPRGLDLSASRKAEAEARAAGRGMWQLGERYVSPKDWRKTIKR